MRNGKMSVSNYWWKGQKCLSDQYYNNKTRYSFLVRILIYHLISNSSYPRLMSGTYDYVLNYMLYVYIYMHICIDVYV